MLIAAPRPLEPALRGFVPNPAGRYVAVSLSLAERGDASLEVIDMLGRRVAYRHLAGLGPGEHVVTLPELGRLAAGVFLIRLRQGGRALVTRGVVVR